MDVNFHTCNAIMNFSNYNIRFVFEFELIQSDIQLNINN